MRFSILALLVVSMFVAGCGGSLRDSSFNPSNWFGRSTSQEADADTVTTPDGRKEEVNPLIGERKQSQIVAANRRADRKSSGSLLDVFDKETPYQGTRVDRVTGLVVEPTSTGAIVRATGISGRQGAFDVRLLPIDEDQPRDGVMTYEFLALQPVNTPQGPEQTRKIQAATSLKPGALENIRTIRVVGRSNTRTTRR